ncbi:MAG: UPF0149 family protein [Gallionella sp.]|nr:UPF0149 family protein [Gallionella sp.]
MKPIQALSDAEIDELDEFLLSDDVPENCMDISRLDGFFAALVLNPRLVMPSEYLPWIWDSEEGEDAPGFASIEQANRIMALLMRYYNGVLDAIAGNRFSPLFYTLAQGDGGKYYEAEGWAEGFMLGVFLFIEPWRAVFESEQESLSPMVLLGTQQGAELLEKSADVKQARKEAYDSIADAVAILYDYFTAQREAETAQRRVSQAVSVKVPPNEECPCGSGLKFKKCCGASPTLH